MHRFRHPSVIVLLLLITGIILFLPVVRSFYGKKPALCHHVTLIKKHPLERSRPQLSGFALIASWALIRNRQLHVHHTVNQKLTVRIILLFLFCRLISLAQNRDYLISYSHYKTKPFPIGLKYLWYQLLLI